ncbi:MAG: hypothetical protein R3E66_01275 [bacterium]
MKAIWVGFLAIVMLLAALPTSFAMRSDDGPSIKWMASQDVSIAREAPKNLEGASPLSTLLGLESGPIVQSDLPRRSSEPRNPTGWCMSRKMRLSISPGHSPPTV